MFSYFDLYRHLRQQRLPLWTANPGWGSSDIRDHFEAHYGMEVGLPAWARIPKTWLVFKYGMGPLVDGIFSESNDGIVTRMGFCLIEEPGALLPHRIVIC